MAIIRTKISEAIYKFQTYSRKRASSIYLGRNEMRLLLQWAHENQYVSSPDADIEGSHRLEVEGLLCWQVNADNHLTVA